MDVRTPNITAKSEDEFAVAVHVVKIVDTLEYTLLVKRHEFAEKLPGIWVKPGGKPRIGETIIQCGMRELAEETGLVLQAHPAKTHIYKRRKTPSGKPLYEFKVVVTPPFVIVLEDKFTDYGWYLE